VPQRGLEDREPRRFAVRTVAVSITTPISTTFPASTMTPSGSWRSSFVPQ